MLSDETGQLIKALPSILSIQEVADFFSVHRLTAYRLIYRKKLAAYKDDDGNWCVLPCDLEKFCSKTVICKVIFK